MSCSGCLRELLAVQHLVPIVCFGAFSVWCGAWDVSGVGGRGGCLGLRVSRNVWGFTVARRLRLQGWFVTCGQGLVWAVGVYVACRVVIWGLLRSLGIIVHFEFCCPWLLSGLFEGCVTDSSLLSVGLSEPRWLGTSGVRLLVRVSLSAFVELRLTPALGRTAEVSARGRILPLLEPSGALAYFTRRMPLSRKRS